MTNTRGPALARAAEAMLRALGGCEVRLRCPVAAARDAQARQLGLDAPLTDDISVAPVVVRGCPTLTAVGRVGNDNTDVELLIAPATLAQYLQDRGQTAEQFFHAVLAVLVAGRELKVKSLHEEQFAGSAYLYRVVVS